MAPYTNTKRIEDALHSLTRRIEAGEEFPDACWAVACRQSVPYEALQAAYDASCLEKEGN